MTELERVFNCISRLENLKKQAKVDCSHFYVKAAATDAITLLYAYASTFQEKEDPRL